MVEVCSNSHLHCMIHGTSRSLTKYLLMVNNEQIFTSYVTVSARISTYNTRQGGCASQIVQRRFEITTWNDFISGKLLAPSERSNIAVRAFTTSHSVRSGRMWWCGIKAELEGIYVEQCSNLTIWVFPFKGLHTWIFNWHPHGSHSAFFSLLITGEKIGRKIRINI